MPEITQNVVGTGPASLADAAVAFSNIVPCFGAKMFVLTARAASGKINTLGLFIASVQVAPADMDAASGGFDKVNTSDDISDATLTAVPLAATWISMVNVPLVVAPTPFPAVRVQVGCGGDFAIATATASGAVVGLVLTLRAIF